MGKLSLREISEEVSRSLDKFYSDYDWQTKDSILEQACSSLSSKRLEFLIPKVVLVDVYYQANLIKYVSPKPNKKDEVDYRFGYYNLRNL